MIPVTNSGTTAEREAPERDHAVDRRVALERGEDSAEDGERDDDHECERRELERVDERVADQVADTGTP